MSHDLKFKILNLMDLPTITALIIKIHTCMANVATNALINVS